jgi:hypothetical protein
MAIRTAVFKELNIDKVWSKTISDDLSLSYTIKLAGFKVAFVPACLAASYEQIDWKGLLEFGRRQFLITKVSAVWTWITGFLGSILGVFGPILTAGIGIYALLAEVKFAYLYVCVPFLLLLMQFLQAILRQTMLGKMLMEEREQMKKARTFDICMFWPMSYLFLIIMLTSVFGRTIHWRGIRYKLLGPTETVMLD